MRDSVWPKPHIAKVNNEGTQPKDEILPSRASGTAPRFFCAGSSDFEWCGNRARLHPSTTCCWLDALRVRIRWREVAGFLPLAAFVLVAIADGRAVEITLLRGILPHTYLHPAMLEGSDQATLPVLFLDVSGSACL